MLNFKLKFTVPSKGEFSSSGSLKEKERVVLMGPSGCGKTTFLRSLMGFHTSAFVSELSLNGVDLSKMPVSQRGFGVAFQGGALLPHLTAFENILLPFQYSKKGRLMSKNERKTFVETEMARLNIVDKAFSLSSELSGGERQRVAVLRALVTQPQVVFLDEPSAGIDPSQKVHLIDWIEKSLESSNATALVVTHDEAVAQSLGTRVLHWPVEPSKVIQF